MSDMDMVRPVEVTKRLAGVGDLDDDLIPKPTEVEKTRQGRERLRPHPTELWQRRMQMAALHAKGIYQHVIAKQFGVSAGLVSQEINALVQEFRAEALKSIGERIAAEDALLYMVQLEAINAWFQSKEGKLTQTSKKIRELRGLGGAQGGMGKGAGRKKAFKDRYDPIITDFRTRDALDETFGYDPTKDPLHDLEACFADPEPINGDGREQSERNEETERFEESPGDPAFLRIILDCHDRRAEMHALYPKKTGQQVLASGDNPDDDITAWTPSQRLAKVRSLIEKAKLSKATQLAIRSAQGSATAEVLNQQPLNIFETRAQQIGEGQSPTPIDAPLVVPVIAHKEETQK